MEDNNIWADVTALKEALKLERHRVEELELLLRSQEAVEVRVEALWWALYKAAEENALRNFVGYEIKPERRYPGGDFFWGRRFKDHVVIVVGDASGKHFYSAFLNILMGVRLDIIDLEKLLGDRTCSPSKALTRELVRDFSDLMLRAIAHLQPSSKAYESILQRMPDEGYSMAVIVIDREQVHITCAGLPIFWVRNGAVERLSDFSSAVDGKAVSANTDPNTDWDTFEETHATLRQDGARYLFVTSDGIPELYRGKATFGEKRLLEVIAEVERSSNGPGEMASKIMQASEHFRTGPSDRGVPEEAPSDDRIAVVVDLEEIQKSIGER